jgi:flavin-dependent dehydrogenase
MLRVVSAPYGWWYASPLPDDRVLVCLMSDGDIIRSLDVHRLAGWIALLETSGLLGDRFVPSGDLGRVQVLPCETSILDRVTGDGWIAVGDAACVFDPLASAGVMKALYTARIASDHICEYLRNGSVAGLDWYGGQVARDFQRYLMGRRLQYRVERRWQDRPFWLRRCA